MNFILNCQGCMIPIKSIKLIFIVSNMQPIFRHHLPVIDIQVHVDAFMQARIIVGTSTWFLYVSQSPWLIFHVLRYSPLKSSFNMYIFGNLYFWCIFNLFCSLCVEYFMYYICTCKCMSVVWITLNLSHCKFIVQSLHACMVLVYN